MAKSRFNVQWVDRNLEPTQPPNPEYPDGIDIIISAEQPNCKVPLPYPAKRIGYYVVKCKLCGREAMCTTAGRLDDPRSITVPCKSFKVN